jgi:hypothetical protein
MIDAVAPQTGQQKKSTTRSFSTALRPKATRLQQAGF